MHYLTRITAVRTTDEELQVRGRIVILISLSLILIGVLFILLFLASQPNPWSSVFISTAILPAFAGIALLARNGHVNISSLILIGVVFFSILYQFTIDNNGTNVLFFLNIAILIGGVTLRPWYVWLVLAAVLLGVTLSLTQTPDQLLNDPNYIFQITSSMFLMFLVTMISFLGASITSQALRTSRRTRSDLLQSNTTLTSVLEQQQITNRELQESIASQRMQDALIAQLSIPVIPLHDDILIVPMIGAIDSFRAEQLYNRVLEQIGLRRSRVIILDITGVPLVDVQVARMLLDTARAARLLGARSLLVGLRAEVARTLVSLEVTIDEIETRATLQQALEYLGLRRT